MRELPLGELLDVIIDHRGKTPKKLGGDFTETGVPVVSAIHIKDGRIHWHERFRYVSPEMYKRWMPVPLRTGDVLVTSEAPLGEVSQVPSDDPLVLSQRLFALRGKAEILDSTYLRYFLQSPDAQHRLRMRATGTTVTGIRQSELVKVLVPLPLLEEQRRIVGVLGALEVLIETNRLVAEGICELSRTYFESLTSRCVGTYRLGDVAKVNARKATPHTEGRIQYVDIASLSDGSIDWPGRISWAVAPSRARRLATDGNTLWSTVRPNRRAHALLVNAPDDLIVSTGIAVIAPMVIGPAYLYAATDRQDFTDHLVNRAEGSAYPAVRADAFEAALIPRLCDDDAAAFEAVMWPLWQAVAELGREQAELVRARDELLPLLLSGAIRVDAVEA